MRSIDRRGDSTRKIPRDLPIAEVAHLERARRGAMTIGEDDLTAISRRIRVRRRDGKQHRDDRQPHAKTISQLDA
jgi:hypothetical protein